MLRYYVIFIVALGIIGSMLGRGGPQKAPEGNQLLIASGQVRVENSSDADFSRSDPSPLPEGTVEIDRSSDGHFYADVLINGATIHMMVDTGASGVALSRDDAHAAGVATSIGMNEVVGRGADGDVHGEYVSLDRVELGPKRAEGVGAIILNGGEQSLLGQSFLRQFASVEIQGDRMLLR
jgi:aspartyl protease family protein